MSNEYHASNAMDASSGGEKKIHLCANEIYEKVRLSFCVKKKSEFQHIL
jgi:hypothetical protein